MVVVLTYPFLPALLMEPINQPGSARLIPRTPRHSSRVSCTEEVATSEGWRASPRFVDMIAGDTGWAAERQVRNGARFVRPFDGQALQGRRKAAFIAQSKESRGFLWAQGSAVGLGGSRGCDVIPSCSRSEFSFSTHFVVISFTFFVVMREETDILPIPESLV